MKYDVFISYSSADSKHAFDVCSFLESNNLKCWIAPRNIRPGAPYAHEIVQGINNSSIAVLILSYSSQKSEHVRNEIDLLLKRGITILPFVINELNINDSYYTKLSQINNLLKRLLEHEIEFRDKPILSINTDFPCELYVNSHYFGELHKGITKVPLLEGKNKLKVIAYNRKYERNINVKGKPGHQTLRLTIKSMPTETRKLETAILLKLNDKYHNISPSFINGYIVADNTVIDRDGNEVLNLPSSYFKISVSEDTVLVAKGFNGRTLLGFLDLDGDNITPIKFVHAKLFKNGYAAVCDDNRKWGYINKAGDIIIPHVYDSANSFVDGLATVQIDGLWSIIDKNNQIKCTLRGKCQKLFSEGLLAVEDKGKWGYVNNEGKVSIPLEYEYATNFTCGRAAVKANGKYGFIDKNGNALIPFVYDSCSSYVDGFYTSIVRLNEKYGIIDIHGNCLLAPEYDSIETWYNHQYLLLKDGRYGLCTMDGKFKTKTEYDLNGLDRFNHNVYLLLRNDTTWEILNSRFQIVHRFEDGADVYPFVHSKPITFYSIDDKYALINTKGEPLTEEIYDKIYFDDDDIYAERDEKYGMLDDKGYEKIPFIYDSVHRIDSEDVIVGMIDGLEIYHNRDGSFYHIYEEKSCEMELLIDNYIEMLALIKQQLRLLKDNVISNQEYRSFVREISKSITDQIQNLQ